jgi:hypothetical protein
MATPRNSSTAPRPTNGTLPRPHGGRGRRNTALAIAAIYRWSRATHRDCHGPCRCPDVPMSVRAPGPNAIFLTAAHGSLVTGRLAGTGQSAAAAVRAMVDPHDRVAHGSPERPRRRRLIGRQVRPQRVLRIPDGAPVLRRRVPRSWPAFGSHTGGASCLNPHGTAVASAARRPVRVASTAEERSCRGFVAWPPYGAAPSPPGRVAFCYTVRVIPRNTWSRRSPCCGHGHRLMCRLSRRGPLPRRRSARGLRSARRVRSR